MEDLSWQSMSTVYYDEQGYPKKFVPTKQISPGSLRQPPQFMYALNPNRGGKKLDAVAMVEHERLIDSLKNFSIR